MPRCLSIARSLRRQSPYWVMGAAAIVVAINLGWTLASAPRPWLMVLSNSPALAAGPDGWLVGWRHRQDPSRDELHTGILRVDRWQLDGVRRLSGQLGEINRADARWNGRHFVLAWSQTPEDADGVYWDSFLVQKLDAQGAPAGKQTGLGCLGHCIGPSLRWSGTSWGLVWLQEVPSGPNETRFARLDGESQPVGKEIRLESDVGWTLPRMEVIEDRFVTVWSSHTALRLQTLDADGTPRPRTTLAYFPGEITGIGLAADGGTLTLLTSLFRDDQGDGLWFTRATEEHALAPPRRIAGVSCEASRPALAQSRGALVAVWIEPSGDDRYSHHLYGARIGDDGQLVNAPARLDPRYVVSPPTLASDGQSVVVAWYGARGHEQAPFVLRLDSSGRPQGEPLQLGPWR